MRLSFIIISLLFGDILFSGLVHAQTLHPKAHQNAFIPDDPAFEGVNKAYKAFNFPKAIKLTKELIVREREQTIGKSAAFLLGDLYFNMAEKGRPLEYKRAIQAFQRARASYRHSEEAVAALLKIGRIYLKQRLFYEALASFNRVIKNHPEHPLVIPAQFGKAQIYFTWRKYEKAIAEYDLIDPKKLKPDEQMSLLFGYGDTYQRLNMANTAYSYYKLVPVDDPVLAKHPATIFQYGISALRAGDYGPAIKLLTLLQDRYPGGPDTLLALVRIGDAWRLQGMSHRAKNIYKTVRKAHKRNTDGQLAKIAEAVGSLHLAGCKPRPILLSEADCKRMKPLSSKAGLAALERISLKSRLLLANFDNPKPEIRLELIEDLLFQSIVALDQHGAARLSLQLKEQLLEKKIHKNTRKKLEATLPETVIKAGTQLLAGDDPIAVLTVFFRYRSHFSEEILKGNIGLQIGIRLTEAGFYDEAITVLKPVAEPKEKKVSGEALYYLVQSQVQLGAYPEAKQGLLSYMKRYPKNQRGADLQMISAKLSGHEGDISGAIKKYRAWLVKYPEDKRAQQVRLALARSYEENGALDQALTVYLKLVQKKGDRSDRLHIKVADLYFQLKQYKEAEIYYQKILEAGEEGSEKEWVQLQLANSYAALGQTKQGTDLFAQLLKQSEDEIIKGFAAQKTAIPE